jgi:hypothetical protein
VSKINFWLETEEEKDVTLLPCGTKGRVIYEHKDQMVQIWDQKVRNYPALLFPSELEIVHNISRYWYVAISKGFLLQGP